MKPEIATAYMRLEIAAEELARAKTRDGVWALASIHSTMAKLKGGKPTKGMLNAQWWKGMEDLDEVVETALSIASKVEINRAAQAVKFPLSRTRPNVLRPCPRCGEMVGTREFRTTHGAVCPTIHRKDRRTQG